ncbi:MAG TPA: MarR family transcriptional regulator [Vicinamibacteria bacterium]|nr:MarR family transcriptional regulator [Vicinamibacteria bacterium]
MSGSPLQREIRQRKPFRSSAHEALVGLLRTTDRVRRTLAGVVEPRGLTLQQYNVLRILRGARPAGLPTLEIAARMVEHAPGITRLLDRLEGKTLVRRQRRDDDRRQVMCRITPAGLRLLAGLDSGLQRADESTLGMLSRRDLRRLIALLDRIRAAPASLNKGEER